LISSAHGIRYLPTLDAVTFPIILAQAVPIPDWLTPLSTFGVGGVCLAFFMYWQVKWGGRIEAALNRVARANSLLVISLKQAHDEAKHQAREIIVELDQAEGR
jgi:hypothetical protein